MAFHDVVFPLELGAMTPKTSWQTQITELGGGGEQRATLWMDAKRRYDAKTAETLTLAQFNSVEKFFNARRAQLFSFKLRDRTNFRTATEPFGLGDGSKTQFQLTINRGDTTNAYDREIYLPESGTLHVFDNVVEVFGWTAAYNGATGGIVTFSSAPLSGHVLTATFDYFIPVRFAIDEFPDAKLFIWSSSNTGLISGPDIPLIEVRYPNEF